MKKITYISIVFVVLAVLYFSQVQLPSKLAYPVAFLGLMALLDYKYVGISMALGLVFSALGDWQGTQGNFLGQMGCFALAHVAYIGYFISRLCTKLYWKIAISWAIPCIVIGVFAFIKVVPMVPPGVVKIGVGIYCVLILTMMWTAFLQKDWLFALGAALFVCSDFILAWNKFVSPIGYASWWIMVPYFGAQWMLFYRATCVASSVLQKTPHSSQK
jgi:uncharacterized membrane protein YhhN